MSKAQTGKKISGEKLPAERELGSEDPKKPSILRREQDLASKVRYCISL